MILTAHQPAYLPWLGLLAKIAAADTFVILDTVQMSGKDKDNYVARTRIKTAQGPQWLTVPVHRGLDVPIKDVQIATDQPWARKHWRTIELAYQKAPFFNQYGLRLAGTFKLPWEDLSSMNEFALVLLLDLFGIRTRVVRASTLNLQGAKSDLILDMCNKVGASEFIFGAHGRDYADVAAFERAGVKVRFQDYQHPEYPQLHGPFVPGLSALDLLFNVGGAEGGRIIRESR